MYIKTYGITLIWILL